MLRNIALAAVIAGFVFIALHYGDLPTRIPSHFNLAGQVDGYAHKGLLWLLAIINLGVYGLLGWVPNAPRELINYPVKITPENEERQHALMIEMIMIMRAVCCLGFAYIIYGTVYSALGRMNGLGNWFMWIFLLGLFVPIGYYYWRAVKRK